jgi:hypothetical protein
LDDLDYKKLIIAYDFLEKNLNSKNEVLEDYYQNFQFNENPIKIVDFIHISFEQTPTITQINSLNLGDFRSDNK